MNGVGKRDPEVAVVFFKRNVLPVIGSQVQLFSEPGFQGEVLVLEESVAFLPDDFHPMSCKVLAGR